MTGRDRIVIVVLAALAVVAAAWLLVLAPEREKASKVGGEVSTAQAQLSTAQSEVNAARSAEAGYPAAYTSLVSLGKAVPTGQEVPSLIFQLEQASNRKQVEFSSITSGGGSGGSGGSSSSATPAVAAAGFTPMPFTFVFSGSFFDLYKLFQQVNRFTLRTSSGSVQVSGRLLTIQGVQLAPETILLGLWNAQQPADGDDHRDRVRASREPGRRDCDRDIAHRRAEHLGLGFVELLPPPP